MTVFEAYEAKYKVAEWTAQCQNIPIRRPPLAERKGHGGGGGGWGVLELFFWRGVWPEVWNPYPFLKKFRPQKTADFTGFSKFSQLGTYF